MPTLEKASFTASGGTTSAFGRDTLGGGHQQAGEASDGDESSAPAHLPSARRGQLISEAVCTAAQLSGDTSNHRNYSHQLERLKQRGKRGQIFSLTVVQQPKLLQKQTRRCFRDSYTCVWIISDDYVLSSSGLSDRQTGIKTWSKFKTNLDGPLDIRDGWTLHSDGEHLESRAVADSKLKEVNRRSGTTQRTDTSDESTASSKWYQAVNSRRPVLLTRSLFFREGDTTESSLGRAILVSPPTAEERDEDILNPPDRNHEYQIKKRAGSPGAVAKATRREVAVSSRVAACQTENPLQGSGLRRLGVRLSKASLATSSNGAGSLATRAYTEEVGHDPSYIGDKPKLQTVRRAE
ncbi:hypothetical protein Bbelb_154450 [Branchiostoma belcheri]|nr:hypothetical protein Bbelb_154450 [Branchiostoma belcheri]